MLDIANLGLIVVMAGLVVILAAVAHSSKRGEQEVRGGGVIMIGPIPVIFGSDMRWASVAIVLAILLFVVSLLWYLV